VQEDSDKQAGTTTWQALVLLPTTVLGWQLGPLRHQGKKGGHLSCVLQVCLVEINANTIQKSNA